jgi:hypothetical protein
VTSSADAPPPKDPISTQCATRSRALPRTRIESSTDGGKYVTVRGTSIVGQTYPRLTVSVANFRSLANDQRRCSTSGHHIDIASAMLRLRPLGAHTHSPSQIRENGDGS